MNYSTQTYVWGGGAFAYNILIIPSITYNNKIKLT